MSRQGIQDRVQALLSAVNAAGEYPASLVCTDDGLVVASAGADADDQGTAAFASLFDDVLMRARRDLGFDGVDEVTLLATGRERTVIRPLALPGDTQLFLVVQVPKNRSWRRNTNQLCRDLVPVLSPLVAPEAK